jgi:MFS family permease
MKPCGDGAIASAFSPNIWWLIGFRFILGIGIGGITPFLPPS